jgi:hypothetical protein
VKSVFKSRWIHFWIAFVVATAAAVAVEPAKTSANKKTTSKTVSRKSSAKKKYVSNTRKPPVRKAKAPAKKSKARTQAAKAAPVSAKVRADAHDFVYQNVSDGADIPVENAAALIPFFEQLYRHQRGEVAGPVRILHYGDSHTAADEWTGDLRTRFQEKFGDGGSGFSLAGRPYNSYRRMDVRSGSTRGWHTDGLVGRAGDGVYG